MLAVERSRRTAADLSGVVRLRARRRRADQHERRDGRGGAAARRGQGLALLPSESLPYAYVTVEGPVVFGEITEGEERLQLAACYLGEEMGRGNVETTADVDNVLVTLTPQRWRTTDYAKIPPT